MTIEPKMSVLWAGDNYPDTTRTVWAIEGEYAWVSSPYSPRGYIVPVEDLEPVKPTFKVGRTYRTGSSSNGYRAVVAGVSDDGYAIGWQWNTDNARGKVPWFSNSPEFYEEVENGN